MFLNPGRQQLKVDVKVPSAGLNPAQLGSPGAAPCGGPRPWMRSWDSCSRALAPS